MKKFLPTLLICILAVAGYSQSNLPNGDMEAWHVVTVNDTMSYPQIDGPLWCTLNELVAVPAMLGGPGPLTADKTSDAHSGSWAAKLTSGSLNMYPYNILIPGMIGFTQLDIMAYTIRLGKPCPGCRPTKFTGYYKYEPVLNDSCCAILLASKWNTELRKRDTIGYCRTDFKGIISDWTYFDMNVNYYSEEAPDSLLVLLVSSAGFNMGNLMTGVGQPGSTMIVDDLNIEYPLGINQVLMPEIGVKTYPNPACENMTVELTERIPGGTFDIYSMDGRIISSQAMENTVNTVNVNGLMPGQYFYRLMSGKNIQNTGFFMIK
ncbi:MAG TPA: T9SS type A sorting domain-containing protein [Bacteroidales bacterium]|nr:T9SS type A sorting domain-containing protein [Bacteroidales bacterium]HPS74147.1 T9SS type A sorting domain-containing protein [Bacteroidales bacterium]